MKTPLRPQIITFLIADTVLQEKGTNKWSAVGIFDHLYASTFPVYHPSLGLYVKLTEAVGEYDIRFEFMSQELKQLSVFGGLHLSIQSPLATFDFGIQTHQLLIPEPGRYHFDLYFNDYCCQSLPLMVSPAIKEGVAS